VLLFDSLLLELLLLLLYTSRPFVMLQLPLLLPLLLLLLCLLSGIAAEPVSSSCHFIVYSKYL